MPFRVYSGIYPLFTSLRAVWRLPTCNFSAKAFHPSHQKVFNVLVAIKFRKELIKALSYALSLVWKTSLSVYFEMFNHDALSVLAMYWFWESFLICEFVRQMRFTLMIRCWLNGADYWDRILDRLQTICKVRVKAWTQSWTLKNGCCRVGPDKNLPIFCTIQCDAILQPPFCRDASQR